MNLREFRRKQKRAQALAAKRAEKAALDQEMNHVPELIPTIFYCKQCGKEDYGVAMLYCKECRPTLLKEEDKSVNTRGRKISELGQRHLDAGASDDITIIDANGREVGASALASQFRKELMQRQDPALVRTARLGSKTVRERRLTGRKPRRPSKEMA